MQSMANNILPSLPGVIHCSTILWVMRYWCSVWEQSNRLTPYYVITSSGLLTPRPPRFSTCVYDVQDEQVSREAGCWERQSWSCLHLYVQATDENHPWFSLFEPTSYSQILSHHI